MAADPEHPPERTGDRAASDSAERSALLPPPLPLAQGPLSDSDQAELQQLKEQIRAESGLFCQGYKEKCLRRRIGVRMRARGVHRYADYARLLDSDPAEYARLLDAVTINVSRFFRNGDIWETIASRIVPELFERDTPVRIWSAGSASGEEPYTMAIVLAEYARMHGRERELERFSIESSDIDEGALERARAAEYTALALVDMPPALRERYMEVVGSGPAGTRYRLAPAARDLVTFRQADLIRGNVPGPCDVIICRNVFIYFERDVQEDLLWRFHQALRPGGYLVLGKVETLLGPAAKRLHTVSARERIYRK